MPKGVLLVLTNPVSAEREAEFNDWYTNTHVPEVLEVDGFVAATRYRVSDQQMMPSAEPPAFRYLSIYEVDHDDLGVAMKNLGEAAGGGAMNISDALDMSSAPSAVLYELVAERQVAK